MNDLREISPIDEQMGSPPFLSVIVPTRHRNDLLAKCLDSLAPGAQRLSAERYEVIVTDDGSEMTAAEMVREFYPWAKWRAGPRRGPAANRNSGSRSAGAEWLAFVDDDCIPDPQWLKAYVEAIEVNPSCKVFEGTVYADRPRRTLAEIAPVFAAGGGLPSGNFVCHREIFEAMRGFDERFPYPAMEDVDFRLRLTASHQGFCFVASAAVCHPWRPKGGWKHLREHQKSTFIFLSAHPQEATRIASAYSFRAIGRSFIKSTVPGIFKFGGKGLAEAFLEHLAAFQMHYALAKIKLP